MYNIHPMLVPVLVRWENFTKKAILDKGNPPPWVVGYGHTNANNYPPFVEEGFEVRDEAHAMEILLGELNEVYVPQLKNLFQKIDFKPPNDLYFSGFLDTLYNRGAGRLAGLDAGSEKYPNGSYAWHILKNEQGSKNWLCRAATALTLSHVGNFTPLDTAWDAEIKADRIYDGLTGRRAMDSAICLWERI
jgi:GH24 family phage-related lysozyme (muramidase)